MHNFKVYKRSVCLFPFFSVKQFFSLTGERVFLQNFLLHYSTRVPLSELLEGPHTPPRLATCVAATDDGAASRAFQTGGYPLVGCEMNVLGPNWHFSTKQSRKPQSPLYFVWETDCHPAELVVLGLWTGVLGQSVKWRALCLEGSVGRARRVQLSCGPGSGPGSA